MTETADTVHVSTTIKPAKKKAPAKRKAPAAKKKSKKAPAKKAPAKKTNKKATPASRKLARAIGAARRAGEAAASAVARNAKAIEKIKGPKGEASPKEFVQLYAAMAKAGGTADDLAAKLKISKAGVHTRASRFRRVGVKLPKLGKPTVQVDVGALNALL